MHRCCANRSACNIKVPRDRFKEKPKGEKLTSGSSRCSVYNPHDQSRPDASVALGAELRGPGAQLSSLKRESSMGGAFHSKYITINAFSSIESRTEDALYTHGCFTCEVTDYHLPIICFFFTHASDTGHAYGIPL